MENVACTWAHTHKTRLELPGDRDGSSDWLQQHGGSWGW